DQAEQCGEVNDAGTDAGAEKSAQPKASSAIGQAVADGRGQAGPAQAAGSDAGVICASATGGPVGRSVGADGAADLRIIKRFVEKECAGIREDIESGDGAGGIVVSDDKDIIIAHVQFRQIRDCQGGGYRAQDISAIAQVDSVFSPLITEGTSAA